MKTIIIYNSHYDGILYSIIDGDYSRFNGVHIGSIYNPELEGEVCNFLFHPETGDCLLDFSDDISLLENKQWDKVAIITFLP